MRSSIHSLIASSITVLACAACEPLPPVADTDAPAAMPAAPPPKGHAITPAVPSVNGPGRTLVLPSFTVAPGEEKILCWYVPPDGREHFVSGFHISAAPGSHHLIALRVHDGEGHPATGPEACRIPWDDSPDHYVNGMVLGSLQLENHLALPEGVALRLTRTDGFYFQSHYLNATAKPIVASIIYRMSEISWGQVQQEAGVLVYSIANLDIPPGISSVTRTCKSPHDFNLVVATGHMHEHATRFRAFVDGTPLYETTQWSDDPGGVFPDPGFPVQQSSLITWTCEYDNTTSMPLHFGDSAVKNEMCILGGMFYPVTAGDEALTTCYE